ncbi:hypothetical protein HDU97_010088 [Phlyctochytrium planicorne]|nr:hypothetical protein HDU97_010088 [Phlyctochytrium planicorne]
MDAMAEPLPSAIEVDVVRTSITLFDLIKIPLVISKPVARRFAESEEFESNIWVFGAGQRGSVGIPVSMAAFKQFEKKSEWRFSTEVRKLVRKLAWSAATILLFGSFAVMQVLSFKNEGVKDSFSLSSSYELIQVALDFDFSATGIVKRFWLELRIIPARNEGQAFFLNVTEYLESNTERKEYRHMVPTEYLRKEFRVEFKIRSGEAGDECSQLPWRVGIKGIEYEWGFSTSTQSCLHAETCKLQMPGWPWFQKPYLYIRPSATNHSPNFYNVKFENRIFALLVSTVVAAILLANVFFNLELLWNHDVSLADQVWALFRKKEDGALNRDEQRPLLS